MVRDAPEPVRPAPQDGAAGRDSGFAFVERMELGGGGPAVGVKDSIDIQGFVTRLGSACYADAPPAARHADVVRAVLDAGCRIVGKTNMHELAYGLTGVNGWSGTPLNPRAPKRVPGGSSSGSAVAVAAGLVDFALATDTGGSIRVPAACCGIYGLKPTYGRVSRRGVHPAASTLDCVGPLAAEIALLERAMSMMDPSFRAQAPPARATLGWLQVEAEPQISAAVRAALTRAEVSVRPVVLRSFTAAFGAGLAIISAEMWAAFGHLATDPRLGADVRTRLLASRAVTSGELAAAEAVRTAFRAEVDEVLGQVDALVLPTLPDVPLTLAAAADPRAALRTSTLVRPFNLSGHPALSLPIEVAGLPAGVQLVGRSRGEEALCALAHLLSGPPRPARAPHG